MKDTQVTRRQYVSGLGVALTTGLAGCSEALGEAATSPNDNSTEAQNESAPNQTNNSSTGSESPYTRVYRDVIQSVVLINVSTAEGTGQGSGFVFRNEYIVTNEHVVANASKIQVRFSRGEWRSASIVGTDVSSDLAVIKIKNKPNYAKSLSLVNGEPAIGTEVVAIGNPFGRFDGSASTGIVSGINRSIPAQNGYTIPDAIQTDAAVNPGNSGGPLVNLDAQVVGVINSEGGENIAFAIPASLAKRVVPALIEDGEYNHAYMGVKLATVTPTVAKANNIGRPRGVYVAEVVPNGPAAGILQGSKKRTRVDGKAVPAGGDVIVALNGNEVNTRQQLSSFLALKTSPRETIDVTLLRDGKRKTVELKLSARPRSGARNRADGPTPTR